MSNILRAQQDPPFGWFYKWTKLNEYGVSKDDIDTALKQPETIKVKWDRAQSNGRSSRPPEASADIVPDKAMLGPEYALIYTIPDFESKIKGRMDSSDANYGKLLFQLFGQCLQHKSKTKWHEVVRDYPDDEKNEETLKVAMKTYLEKVANIKNLGDVLIRQLRFRSKPAAMRFDDYLARRQEWMRHLEGEYLNRGLALPTEQELAEQIFEQQPKSHQRKYAAEHEEVEKDEDQLRVFFNGCHASDRSDGTYAKILKSTLEARKTKDLREKGLAVERKPTARRSYQGNAGRNRSTSTYRSRDGGSRSSYRSGGYDGRSRDREFKRSYRSDSGRDRGRNDYRKERSRESSSARGRPRDSRDSRRRDGKRHGRENNHSHHVDRDDENSKDRSKSPDRSCSRSRSRERSRSRSRSRSAGHSSTGIPFSEDEMHMMEEDDRSDKKGREKEESAPRWEREKDRPRNKITFEDEDGTIRGFGSWYKRTPMHYSCDELHAKQGHPDRIRTVDLCWSDAKQRRNRDDDSQLPSDWKDRTSIDDREYYFAQKKKYKYERAPGPCGKTAYQA